MSPIGWCSNLAKANNYFTTERLVSTCWDGLETSGDAKKTAALMMAYNRLYYGGEFNLPTYAVATAKQLVILVKAQCEMAYYLCVHQSDEDRRKGLNVQGVIKAGIVKETYHEDWLEKIPIPPIVWGMLKDYKTKKHFYGFDIERDEDESVR